MQKWQKCWKLLLQSCMNFDYFSLFSQNLQKISGRKYWEFQEAVHKHNLRQKEYYLFTAFIKLMVNRY